MQFSALFFSFVITAHAVTQTIADTAVIEPTRPAQLFDFSQNIQITLGDGISSESRKDSLKNSESDFETDSVVYIDFWMLDPFETDTAKWIFIGDISEEVLVRPAVVRFDDMPDSLAPKWDPITVKTGPRMRANNEFASLLPLLDSVAVPTDTLILKQSTYSPCNFYEGQSVELENGITIRYICWQGMLTATNANGKVIWTKELEKFTDSFISGMAYSDCKGYDVLIKTIDGEHYVLNSKSGKVKWFELG